MIYCLISGHSTNSDSHEMFVEQISPFKSVDHHLTMPLRLESSFFQDNSSGVSVTNSVHHTSGTNSNTLETNVEQTSKVTAVEDQPTLTANVISPFFQDNKSGVSDKNAIHHTFSTDGDTLETNVEQTYGVTALEDPPTFTARVESPLFQDNTPGMSDTNTVHHTSSMDDDTLETNVEQTSRVTAVEDPPTYTARVESPLFQDNTPGMSDTNTVHHTCSMDDDTLETNVEQTSRVTAVEDPLTYTAGVESPLFQDNTPGMSHTNAVHQTSGMDGSHEYTARVECPFFEDNTPGVSYKNAVHNTSGMDGDTLETTVEQTYRVTAVEDPPTYTARVENPFFQDNTPGMSDTNTEHQTSSTDGYTLETTVEQTYGVTAVEDPPTYTAKVESPLFQDNIPGMPDTNIVHQTSSKDGYTLETTVEQTYRVTALEDPPTYTARVESPFFQDNKPGVSYTITIHHTSSMDGDTLERNVEQTSRDTALEDPLSFPNSVKSLFLEYNPDPSIDDRVDSSSVDDGSESDEFPMLQQLKEGKIAIILADFV
jgi:hypothetical protein